MFLEQPRVTPWYSSNPGGTVTPAPCSGSAGDAAFDTGTHGKSIFVLVHVFLRSQLRYWDTGIKYYVWLGTMDF